MFVQLECYAAPGAGPLSVTVELLSTDGNRLLSLPNPEVNDDRTRFELPVRGLGKGTYLLRVRGEVGDQQTEHVVAFKVTP